MQEIKPSTERKLVLFLLLSSFVLGVQYVFLTPPWQAPDENTHYEYIDILSRATIFNIKQEPDFDLQKEIIKSMDQFNAWKYVFRERPTPLPEVFSNCPLYGGSNSKINNPPFYYILGSFVLKILKINNLLLKHYIIRLFSLFLSIITILFIYLTAKIIFNNDILYSFTAACFVAFLPQFIVTSSSINSDSLANMIGSLSIYAFIYSLKDHKKNYILFLFPFLIILGILSKKTTFFIIPCLIIFIFIYSIRNWQENKRDIIFLILISIIITIFAYFLIKFIFPELFRRIVYKYFLPWEGGLQVWRKLFQRSFYAEFNMHFIQVLFRSFWYYAGWMAFPLPNYIYNILKIFTLFGILGAIKYVISNLFQKKNKVSVKFEYVILLFSFCFFSLSALLFRLRFTVEPMARYLFPALSAFAILFVIGLKELIPFKSRKIVLMSIIFLFIVLNIYAIFHQLINVFYFYFW